jgi:hypothetical protein
MISQNLRGQTLSLSDFFISTICILIPRLGTMALGGRIDLMCSKAKYASASAPFFSGRRPRIKPIESKNLVKPNRGATQRSCISESRFTASHSLP